MKLSSAISAVYGGVYGVVILLTSIYCFWEVKDPEKAKKFINDCLAGLPCFPKTDKQAANNTNNGRTESTQSIFLISFAYSFLVISVDQNRVYINIYNQYECDITYNHYTQI